MTCGTALAPAVTAPPGGAELSQSPANYTPAHLARRILADRQQLRGERKHVTVLFCDLAESTSLACALGAEDMHTFLSTFFETVLAEVHRFEGTVNQFLGDGFMAIFGAPLAYEDHAARAGLAALAIGAAIDRARGAAAHRGWERAQVRMGLNSGEVVVGAIGDDLRMDYTAAGDTTHLAARLQGLAGPGEILCGEATVHAARGALEVTPLAPVTLKGIPGPVTCYRLTAARERTLRPVRWQAPFFGREAELAVLNAALLRVTKHDGGVVEVEGEPGAGKSRLMLEFLAQVPASTLKVSGQCITYGNQRPNAPIRELVAGLLAVTPAEPAGTEPGNADYLHALLGEPAAVARVKDLDPATVRGRTLQALLDQVQRLAAHAPLVIVVEDLHWADPSTLEFLSGLALAIQTLPCLMIVTFRPGSDPPWPATARLSRLRLAPLNAAAALALMSQLLAATVLSSEVQAQVLSRAEGNPFFLEELVRAAVSTGEQVPGDVFDVIGARIDRLAPAEKRQLRAASVLGREFSLDLLEEIVPDSGDSRPKLDRLSALGFIESGDSPRQFRFVHALTQEVAYQSMLGEERRQLHSSAAERLAARAVSPEEFCEEIAHHHLMGRAPALALPYLETATAKAIRNHTLEAAHDYLTNAMRLFEAEEMTPERLVRCVSYLLHAFPVFHFLHKHREYESYLARYATKVESLANPALLAAFLTQWGHRLMIQARFPESEAALNRALELCVEVGDLANESHSAMLLSWIYAMTARYEESEACGRRSLSCVARRPDSTMLCFAHVGLTLCYAVQGRLREALVSAEAAREVGLTAHDDGMTSFGGGFLAWVYYELDDNERVLFESQKAVSVGPTNYFKGWAATYMACAMARMGQSSDAIGILDQAVGYSYQAGHLFGYSLVALLRLEALIEAAQYARADQDAEALRSLTLPMPYPFVAAGALQARAECAFRQADFESALELFRAAEIEFTAIRSKHRIEKIAARIDDVRRAMAGPA